MLDDDEIVNWDDSEPEPVADSPYPSRDPVLPPEAAMDEPSTANAPWEKDDA